MRVAPARAKRPRSRRQAFTALAVAAAVLAAAGCGTARSRHPPANLLLVTLDTLRADHLRAWGYPRATSPHLDRLAAAGFVFAQAWAQWPKTGPSFASLLTSTYPKDNGLVRKVGVPLPLGLRLLSEELRAAGFANHAVVANGALASEFGYGQGFDSYVETWKLEGFPGLEAATRGAVVTREALRVATAIDPTRPFFLWVHYLDPHAPYAPPEPWAGRFVGDAHYDPTRLVPVGSGQQREMGGIGRSQVLSGHREQAFYVARYDAEIAYADAMMGELLAGLERSGLLERTLVAVTADHGESLGEHDYYFRHGRLPFETCLHVPLLFHLPDRIRPGRDEAPVELVDLAPTLLEFAGVELEAGRWMQGRSLAPRLAGRGPRPSYAHAESGYAVDRNWQRAIRDDRLKLVFAPWLHDQRYIGGPGQPFTLYDLAEDPGETHNLVAERPEDFARLRDALLAWWEAPAFATLVDDEEGTPPEMGPETRDHLEALGYLQ